MTGHRDDFRTLSHIVPQSFLNLITEIYNRTVTTFSLHNNTAVVKIHILNVKTDTFGNTDPGTK